MENMENMENMSHRIISLPYKMEFKLNESKTITIPNKLNDNYFLNSIENTYIDNNRNFDIKLLDNKNIINFNSAYMNDKNILSLSKYINDIISCESLSLTIKNNATIRENNTCEKASLTINLIYKYIEPCILHTTYISNASNYNLKQIFADKSTYFTDICVMSPKKIKVTIIPIFTDKNNIYNSYTLKSNEWLSDMYYKSDILFLTKNMLYYNLIIEDEEQCEYIRQNYILVFKGYVSHDSFSEK